MISAATSTPIIQLNRTSLGYRTESNAVLNDISLQFFAGDIVAVIGPNGAGKSTLLKSIVGLIRPLKGEIIVHGGRNSAHKDCVSYIPQKEAIDWNYPITVREVVMMGRFGKIPFYRRPSIEDEQIIKQAMERMDICSLANRKIRDCSGGQQQRVFLARSLAQQPHILLMDEPFNAVDIATETIILENLAIFRRQGVTALVATHDLALVSEHFEKVLLLNHQVIAFGSQSEVMTYENLQKAYGGKIPSGTKTAQ